MCSIPLKETVPCSCSLKSTLQWETSSLIYILISKIIDKYDKIFNDSNNYNKITRHYIVHCLENISETISLIADYFRNDEWHIYNRSSTISTINSRRFKFSQITQSLIVLYSSSTHPADKHNLNNEIDALIDRPLLSVRSKCWCDICTKDSGIETRTCYRQRDVKNILSYLI